MRVTFYTFGCKVNQYETQTVKNQFAEDGFSIVSPKENAEIHVINSCTVTNSGDKKIFQLIHHIKSKNPNAIIALMGCFPQAFPQQAELLSEVSILQGSRDKSMLLSAVKQFLKTHERIVNIKPHDNTEIFEPMKISSFDEHTRAFVKIEDGCDRYCTYCIIPKARGNIRSKPLVDLKKELLTLAQNGYCEVVLVGINLCSYGKDRSYAMRLADAVALACQIDGIKRVRLGSLEPELLTSEDFEKLAAEEKFCPQFHLSLQSGCDDTLKRMNRHYTSAEYKKIVDNIRLHFKNPAITTDIMVGFAGETDREFNESLEFVKSIGFARMHVFPYSIREGTKAALMENQIPQQEKIARAQKMQALGDIMRQDFLKSQENTLHEVLFETKLSDNTYVGYSKNYVKIKTKSDTDICGQIVVVPANSDCFIAN